MTDTDTETDAPVAHTHEGQGDHEHVDGAVPHTHEPSASTGYVPDPGVQAYCTTVTLVVAHTAESSPYEVVKAITEQLEGMGLRGVVTGVAAVELRGDGGLIGL